MNINNLIIKNDIQFNINLINFIQKIKPEIITLNIRNYLQLIQVIPEYMNNIKQINIEINKIDFNFDKIFLNKQQNINFIITTKNFDYKENFFNDIILFIKKAIKYNYNIYINVIMDEKILLKETKKIYDFADFFKNLQVTNITIFNQLNENFVKYKKIVRIMEDHIFLINNRICKKYECNDFLFTNFCNGECKHNVKDLILDEKGLLYLKCPHLKFPLCHYTNYNFNLYKSGLYIINKYSSECGNIEKCYNKNIFKIASEIEKKV